MKVLQVLVLVLCAALAACASSTPKAQVHPVAVPGKSSGGEPENTPPTAGAPEPSSEGSPKSPPLAGASDSAVAAGESAVGEPAPPELAPSRSPLEDGRGSDRGRPLPLLTFRSVGMHVGGGTNTREEKLPYLRAIEARGRDLLLCYRLVNEGSRGGTFGIDLVIPLEGGSPELGATRQKLGGAPFDDCMRKVMSSVRFPAPTRRTALSYSLRFDLAAP